ncbi:hypothetical protein [Actinoplanes sp. NPDC051494]|uniref:hypothetical protein n=1 Tax=Actinoplanes sp. NPDC051494 TaxID=3363907 RepID=UPI00379F6D30
MKLKLNRRQIVIGAVVLLVAVAALFASRSDQAEGPGVADDAATRACTDFAGGYGDAKNKTARLSLADRVMESSVETGNDAIRDRAAEMGRSANETDRVWKTSGDALINACEDAGWRQP